MKFMVAHCEFLETNLDHIGRMVLDPASLHSSHCAIDQIRVRKQRNDRNAALRTRLLAEFQDGAPKSPKFLSIESQAEGGVS
jgi:hypothetical protein